MTDSKDAFDFERTCQLAHLDVPQSEKAAMKQSIQDVLGYMETLNKLDIDHLEPSSHAAEQETLLREDIIVKHDDLKMEENAPDWQDEAFWVPQLKA